jgi:hypothetical protein
MTAGLGSSVTASECWDTSFHIVYQTSAPEVANIVPTMGNESACAFSTAALP